MGEQKDFIKLLSEKVQKGNKLVDEIALVLKISHQGAYKKMQCNSKLTFNEIRDLCTYFKVSFDKVLSADNSDNKDPYPFYSDALKYAPDSYSQYWSNLLQHLNRYAEYADLYGFYLCNEVPFFYYTQFPNLLHFKMYIWNKTSWRMPGMNDTFDPSIFTKDKSLAEVVKKVTTYYHSYPTTEIWNPDMMRMTMMQINYAIKGGLINNKEDLDAILSDMDKMVRYMEKISISGIKFIFGNKEQLCPVEIYVNELSVNSELIFIKSKDYKILYNKYDSPNYLRSDDQRICKHAENWISDIINLSVKISAVGQGNRQQFFKVINGDIYNFTKKTELLFAAYN